MSRGVCGGKGGRASTAIGRPVYFAVRYGFDVMRTTETKSTWVRNTLSFLV